MKVIAAIQADLESTPIGTRSRLADELGGVPILRRTVERAALGCDAAVLVRRADKPPCPAWNEVLAAIGLTVIGEAVTFETALVSG